MKNTTLILAALTLSTSAFATDLLNNVTVTSIYMQASGKALVQFSSNPVNSRPVCGGSAITTTELAIDTATDGGKAMHAELLAAKLAGKQVQVAASGTCTIFATNENISAIKLLP